MAEHMNFYHLAYYYDVAMYRDVSSQLDFFCKVFHHYMGREMESLLDIACGPGYHAAEAARRGLYAVGLDLMPEMLEYADSLTEEGLFVEWLAADMREFQLGRPVDMAINVFDSIDALTQNADVVRHFQSVAKNLTDGGLYLLQHTHPRDCNLSNYGHHEYVGERDDTHVRIEWATNEPQFDLITGVAHVEIKLHICENGTTKVLNDQANERLFTPQVFQLLSELSGVFEIVGWYGDFDLNQPFDRSEKSQSMIIIMRKKGAENDR